MAEKKQGNTVSVVWDLAKPIAEKLGLNLWDVRFQKEGAVWYLRIFIAVVDVNHFNGKVKKHIWLLSEVSDS